MHDRVLRIYEHLEEPVDVLVLMNSAEPHLDQSFFYVTDLVGGGLFEGSVALCWPDGAVEVVTSPLEEASARKGSATVTVAQNNAEHKAVLEDRIRGLDRIGLNAGEVVYRNVQRLQEAAPDAELVDVSDAVVRARLVKDGIEIKRMRRAGEIASAVATEIPELLREGMREEELAAEINYRMAKRGASGPSFEAIVAFAEASAEPHYSPTEAKLERDQYVLCDYGCLVKKYASDITRTFVFGNPTDKHREIYETVLAAQEAALDAIRPGAQGGAVHQAAADLIDASPYKGRFIHTVGHSLGLAVHDGGRLHPSADVTLEEGQVWTVEPGVYVPGFGGVRIEDDIVVTSDGYDFLTDAPKSWDDAVVG